MAVPSLIVFARRADWQSFAFSYPREMFAHWRERIYVDQRLIAQSAQIADDVEDRRLRRAVGERRYRRVHDAHALFHCFEQVEGREPVVAVGVKLERNIADVLLDQTHQRARALRRQHAANILEAQTIRLQPRGVARLLRVIFMVWRGEIE